MRRRLILSGPIGCGKSTLIKNAVCDRAARAGGFITVRARENGELRGFDLMPARALVCPGQEARRFLDFGESGAKRDGSVFSDYAAVLLSQARTAPFAVVDEFGGWELMIPEFREALEAFLRSDTPCVGVLKSLAAAEELDRRIGLGGEYLAAARALREALGADENTLLLETGGRYDTGAEGKLRAWAEEYA